MTALKVLVAALALLIGGAMASPAAADDKATVQTFYDFLSNPSSAEATAAVEAVLAENWESIGDYSGAVKSRDVFIAQIGGFGALIPDLNWAVEEMLQDGDRVIVRGRATGAPNGPLFGVNGGGKSFEIMSIDIHTVKDGKIIRTYHVEDWAGALSQLSAE